MRRPLNRIAGDGGQATTEMVLVVPLFLLLAAAAAFVVYVCWQGLKVQQAANLAARIQGQEKVGGGKTIDEIDAVNGSREDGDSDPTEQDEDGLPSGKPKGELQQGSVYAKYRRLVRRMFSDSEVDGNWGGLFVPKPQEGPNVDRVTVIRSIEVPSKLRAVGLPQRINVKGVAYGGEDTYMYGLPRWGSPATGGEREWERIIKQPKDD